VTPANAKRILLLAEVCYPRSITEGKFVLNMNDTWCWASAWGEEIPDDKIVEVASLFKRYGDCGLLYWVSEQNDGMRSEFEDINRFVDFVRQEEQVRKDVPESTKSSRDTRWICSSSTLTCSRT
jgi:hypothetical protein